MEFMSTGPSHRPPALMIFWRKRKRSSWRLSPPGSRGGPCKRMCGWPAACKAAGGYPHRVAEVAPALAGHPSSRRPLRSSRSSTGRLLLAITAAATGRLLLAVTRDNRCSSARADRVAAATHCFSPAGRCSPSPRPAGFGSRTSAGTDPRCRPRREPLLRHLL
uniref:Uncharacterized protein n=1 Tax=Setaria italica TaxID=4555 RepID=K3YJZ5_SETIT